jgi:hypothetical protein
VDDGLGGTDTGDVYDSDSPALVEQLGRGREAAKLFDVVFELFGRVSDEPLLLEPCFTCRNGLAGAIHQRLLLRGSGDVGPPGSHEQQGLGPIKPPD